MKYIKAKLKVWMEQIDKHWNKYSLKQQQRYTLYGFVIYVSLTILVVAKVCIDTGISEDRMNIGHIKNPTIDKSISDVKKADSLFFILKNKVHEQK